MHALKNLDRELTYEEASRPLMINNVITTLGSFLFLNDPATWPEASVRALVEMEAGERRTFGGGAFAEFDVERID